jgi:hypothetical protein
MDKSAFQLFKNTDRTNTNAWLHNTPIVDYGRVIKVIDMQTVVVEAVIQTSLSREVYTVTLLNLSSALLEISDEPKIGDAVLLLFLRKHHPLMFMSETVNNRDATGYNKFSGVGILMSAVRKVAHTVVSCYEDDGKPVTDITSDAEMYGTFNNLMTVEFCRAVFDSEDEQLITVLFGAGRPLVEKHLARTEREYGFWKDFENELTKMDASVTERYSKYAPVTKDIQGAQTINAGLGTDKDDAPVETDAPVIETVHGKAPVIRDIRSPQTVTVGIGNAETGDAEEERDAPVSETYGSKSPITKDIRGPQTYKIGVGKDDDTEAPVSITLGEHADINLTSKSGVTVKFEKAAMVECGNAWELRITGPVTFHSDDGIVIDAGANTAVKAGGKVYVGNTAMDIHTLLMDLISEIKSLQTFGPPPMHKVHPSSITSLTAYEKKIDALFTPDE